MKQIKALLIVSIILSSCNLDKLLTFEFDDQMSVTIPSTVGVNAPFSVPTPPVRSQASQSFDNNDTRADLVKDVKLKHLSMQIEDPTDQTFSFLQSIKIYISADGLEEILIAEESEVPETVGNLLELISTEVKLDEYIKKEEYEVRTEVVTDESFLKDIEITSTFTFSVTADPL